MPRSTWSVALVPAVLLCACTSASQANSVTARSTSTVVLSSFPLPTPTAYRSVCQLEGSVCACPPGEQGICTDTLPQSVLRPLRLPTVGLGDPCPTSAGHRIDTKGFGGIALGTGPVEPLIAAAGDPLHGVAQLDPKSSTTYSGTWYSFKTLWFTQPSYTGPVLVRGARIDGNGRVAFGEGPIIGHLVIPPGSTINEYEDGYREAPGGTYVEAPGCYAWQIDGADFSYDLVFKAISG